MSTRAILCAGVVILSAGFFLFMKSNVATIVPQEARMANIASSSAASLAPLPEAPLSVSSSPNPSAYPVASAGIDIPNQPHLANPPAIAKGIYLTGWSAGSEKKMNNITSLIGRTELNAVVIDIKDYSGNLSYAADIPLVKSSGALKEIKIIHPNTIIKKLHDNGIYVIGRVTVFQDPVLAAAHPEWALHNKTTSGLWKDSKGLAWMDPAAQPVWDYIISITKDASARGFDEIQFDYVRFASDGALGNISYPYWDQTSTRTAVIANFFKYLRAQMPDTVLSADLFGLATINRDDLGIGQVIESAYKYFDYVSPMVYPSHYATGFLGYKSPAQYPYEVVRYSMEHALARLTGAAAVTAATSTNNSSTAVISGSSTASLPPPSNYRAKLRPWLQDFNLGATYDAAMVRDQIRATEEALGTSSARGKYGGWFLWNASNNYTEGALAP